ncbi:MAG TPA: endolytic transglycosylase MltG, partial [Candidatus Paceibacterota bacterium]|nr:endolytic transglycosylase MltG [Candidatus Paceibacterota bacterium]
MDFPYKFNEPEQPPTGEKPGKVPIFRKKWKPYAVPAASVLAIGFLFNSLFIAPPADFPHGELVHIEKGWSVDEIASYLKERSVIRSAWLFKALSMMTGKQADLIAGYYVMDNRPSAFEIFNRLVAGDYHLVPIKVTIPEGATNEEVGLIVKKLVPAVDLERFKQLTVDLEGYLFPDTYFFLPNTSAEEVVEAMRKNFDTKIATIQTDIEESGRSLHEILTMASLLEEEAITEESKHVISGILWKRIKVGMPLQVDAVFPYIMGKNTFELTLDDLRVDSPYNTYKYKGLPPAPISNPGLESIKAALSPHTSPYFFYLSDM